MIVEGDFVDVYWEYLEPESNMKVLYIPQATSDCWHLQRDDGKIVYVQMFAKMVRHE